jgi:hypothetical protein
MFSPSVDAEHAHGVIAFGEGPVDAAEQAEPSGRQHGDDAKRQQGDDDVLLLGGEQRSEIAGGETDGGKARPHPRACRVVVPGHRLRPAR